MSDLPAERGNAVPQPLGRLPHESPSTWAGRVITTVLPPDAPDDPYGARRLTAAWLAGSSSPNTRDAYASDLAQWLAWCHQHALDPLLARRADLDGWRWAMQQAAAPPAPSTVARRLSAISSWYEYLTDHDLVARNPVPAKGRPRPNPDHSPTIGLSLEEAKAFLAAARADTAPRARRADKPLLIARNRALLACMLDTGARVSEITGATVGDLGWRTGHRTITLLGKGDRTRVRVLVPEVATLVDGYLQVRAERDGVSCNDLTGPLFTTATGRAMDRFAVRHLVRRIAQSAGVPSWDRLTTHSLRHAFATLALDAGAALRDVQDALGHADPRTTRKYDRARGQLSRDPAYRLGDVLSSSAPGSSLTDSGWTSTTNDA